MHYLTTPDICFENIADYDYAAHYMKVDDNEGGQLHLHYVDEGPKEGEPILMLHGEPSWGYAYRKMINPLLAAGHRVIVPDLIGFGKSDKPTRREDHTYQRHLDWINALLLRLELNQITLVCQAWGGLIGLRLVAEYPNLFARVLATNTVLPIKDNQFSSKHLRTKNASNTEYIKVSRVVNAATVHQLSTQTMAAYNAPFPDESYTAGLKQLPLLVPMQESDPSYPTYRKAWQSLKQFNKPFLTVFSDSDPVTRGGDKVLQNLIPGCKGQAHAIIKDSGHLLQEDQNQVLSKALRIFIKANPLT